MINHQYINIGRKVDVRFSTQKVMSENSVSKNLSITNVLGVGGRVGEEHIEYDDNYDYDNDHYIFVIIIMIMIMIMIISL